MINVNTHLKSYFENSSKTPQSSFKILVLLSCCLVVLCLISFYQALTFDFLDFDDTDYIVNNPVVRSGLSWSGLQWAFTSLHVGNWHPLTSIFMMGEVSLFGVNATGFHAINLLLHTINAILLFLILTQATQSLSPSFFAACIFAIHPTRTESVVWIVELKDVLSTFFILWAILLYIKNNKRFGIPIFILYVLSLMSKQMYVTLPALLLVLDYWPLKRFSREKIMGLIFEKIPYAFASISAALIVLSAHSSGWSLASQDAYPLTLRLQNVITSTIQYFENFFLLFKSSSFLDPYRETYPLSLWLPCLLFFLTMTTLVCVFRKRHPYLLSGWLFFTISLLPIIGIIQTGSQALADRFTYFSYVGLAIMFFYFSYAYLSKSKQGRFLFITGGLIISILAAVACAIQVSHWKNVTTLFQHAISVNPKNYFAQFKLGQIFYYDKADPEKAKFHLLQAIALKPSIPAAHDILGQIQSNDGDYKNAEKSFKNAVLYDPNNANLETNLATLYATVKKNNLALIHYKQALQINPSLTEAYSGLLSYGKNTCDFRSIETYLPRIFSLRGQSPLIASLTDWYEKLKGDALIQKEQNCKEILELEEKQRKELEEIDKILTVTKTLKQVDQVQKVYKIY